MLTDDRLGPRGQADLHSANSVISAQICRSAERYTSRGSFAKAPIPTEVAISPIPEGQNILQKGEINISAELLFPERLSTSSVARPKPLNNTNILLTPNL